LSNFERKYGQFDEKCVDGNDVFITKLQAALVCTKFCFMFIGTEFSKLSIEPYKPVGGVWWGTQIDNLNFKLPFYPKKIL
jgi:hypothetical protein